MRILPEHGGYHWVFNDSVRMKVPAHLMPSGVPPEIVRRAFDQATTTPGTFSATVLPTQNCQLACPFCIQNVTVPREGARADRVSSARMVPELASQTADYIRRRSIRSGVTNTRLMLFGGEPLLALDACQTLLNEVVADSALLWTNGVLLDSRRLDILAESGLDTVYVSFDGGPESHDQTRRMITGRGTYDTIVRNILTGALRHPQMRWVIRTSAMPSTMTGQSRLLEDLSALPAGDRVAAYVIGLVDDIGIGFDDVAEVSGGAGVELADQIIELNRRALELGFTVSPRTDLANCPFCSDPDFGITVDADGTLYSCWQTAGRSEMAVGTVVDGVNHQAAESNWVRCDFNVRPHADPGAVQRFWDRIDQDVLDTTQELHGD